MEPIVQYCTFVNSKTGKKCTGKVSKTSKHQNYCWQHERDHLKSINNEPERMEKLWQKQTRDELDRQQKEASVTMIRLRTESLIDQKLRGDEDLKRLQNMSRYGPPLRSNPGVPVHPSLVCSPSLRITHHQQPHLMLSFGQDDNDYR
eukprot:TRINITY_DN896_c0_g1_i3.p1 TRINITY_DN896_c0_g1~~TRINITY_DN896_c0_g1_i3.p1  ORF type:complete len:154 (-),score=18.36 TRINITY_DN896_c0_g1_i3:598-1038(-)